MAIYVYSTKGQHLHVHSCDGYFPRLSGQKCTHVEYVNARIQSLNPMVVESVKPQTIHQYH